MNKETYNEFFENVKAYTYNCPNDIELGSNIRKITNTFVNARSVYNKIKQLTDLDVDVQCNGTVFRFGYWEIPSDDVVVILQENNYSISYVADEDRGELFCYMLSTKK